MKKVIEETEIINVAKFDKIVVWRDGCSTQFQVCFIFGFFTGNLFDAVELSLYYNRKCQGKEPVDNVGGTVKNVILQKVNFLTGLPYCPYTF